MLFKEQRLVQASVKYFSSVSAGAVLVARRPHSVRGAKEEVVGKVWGSGGSASLVERWGGGGPS